MSFSRRNDPPRRFESANARHDDVHQHDVGHQLPAEFDGPFTAVGAADDIHDSDVFKNAAQSDAEQLVIVHEERPNHLPSPC